MRAAFAIAILIGALALVGVDATAQARGLVRETSIAEGERLELTPFSFVIVFARPVALSDVSMIDQDGVSYALSPQRGAADSHNISMPVLPPHGYRLHWRGRAGGQAVQGSVGFVITGCDDPREAALTRTRLAGR